MWLLIKKIQLERRFLASLETLHLKISFECWNTNPEALFTFMLQSQGLLNYVTHITFSGSLDLRYYGDQIKFILVSCPKLVGVFSSSFRKSHSKLLVLRMGFFGSQYIVSFPKTRLELSTLQELQLIDLPQILQTHH